MADETNSNVSKITKNRYFCDLCGLEFRLKSVLTRHIISHLKTRPFQCKICNAKFSNSYTLKRHNLIHSNIKPYICTICEKSYRDSSNFRKHKLRHLNVKYNCSQCEKQFLRKSYLKAHLKTHTKDKIWTCSQCHVKFYTKKDKIRHEATHLGEKLYTCNMCYASFGRKDNLDRHVRNAHSSIKLQNEKDINNIEKFNNLEKNTETSSHQCPTDDRGVCNDNCLLHAIGISNKHMSTKPEIQKTQKDNVWLEILEANNKRESVIFKSKSKPSEETLSECCVSETCSSSSSQSVDSTSNNLKNKCTTGGNILEYHKRKYDEIKKKCELPDEFSIDYVKFDAYYNKLSMQTPPAKVDRSDSIELYKRILFSKYKIKESSESRQSQNNEECLNRNPCSPDTMVNSFVRDSELPDQEIVNPKSSIRRFQTESDTFPSGDIHWRRRLAQISNNETKSAEK